MSKSRLLEFLAAPALWFGAMAWHLSRIAIFRPYYQGIGNGFMTLVSFAGMFVGASILRWGVLGGYDAPSVGAGLLLALVVIGALFVRTGQRPLFCAALGASAVVDLLGSVFFVLGYSDTATAWFLKIYEIVLYGGCYLRFRKDSAVDVFLGRRIAKGD